MLKGRQGSVLKWQNYLGVLTAGEFSCRNHSPHANMSLKGFFRIMQHTLFGIFIFACNHMPKPLGNYLHSCKVCFEITKWEKEKMSFFFFFPTSTQTNWRRKWQPTPVFLPGGSHGWKSLVGYSPRSLKESDTTEQIV